MKRKSRRFWRVTQYYKHKEILVAQIPTTHISEGRLLSLMQTLYAKMWLTDEEIVRSFLRGNIREAQDRLVINTYRSQDPISFQIGDSNRVHAVVVRPGDPLWKEVERTVFDDSDAERANA